VGYCDKFFIEEGAIENSGSELIEVHGVTRGEFGQTLLG